MLASSLSNSERTWRAQVWRATNGELRDTCQEKMLDQIRLVHADRKRFFEENRYWCPAITGNVFC